VKCDMQPAYLLRQGEVGGVRLSGQQVHCTDTQQLRQQDIQLFMGSEERNGGDCV